MSCFSKKARIPEELKPKCRGNSEEKVEEKVKNECKTAGEGKVEMLSGSELYCTIRSVDVALVLFYMPGDTESDWRMKHFIKASTETERDNSMFVAIDCEKDGQFCISQGVNDLSSLKLYCKGADAGVKLDSPSNLQYKEMKDLVESFEPLSC